MGMADICVWYHRSHELKGFDGIGDPPFFFQGSWDHYQGIKEMAYKKQNIKSPKQCPQVLWPENMETKHIISPAIASLFHNHDCLNIPMTQQTEYSLGFMQLLKRHHGFMDRNISSFNFLNILNFCLKPSHNGSKLNQDTKNAARVFWQKLDYLYARGCLSTSHSSKNFSNFNLINMFCLQLISCRLTLFYKHNINEVEENFEGHFWNFEDI